MHGFLFILLEACAAITSLIGSAYALQALSNPKLITRGKPTPGVRMLVFLASARSFLITAATLGAILVQAKEALIWLAGIGVAMQFLDSIQGQVQNSPMRTLMPLGLGLLQLVLLLVVLNAR